MRLVSVLALTLLASAQALACPGGTTAQAGKLEGKDICVLQGTPAGDVTLTSNFSYVLEGDVRIGGDNVNSTKLTIDAGTTIYGNQGAFLVISRGSQIFANGTASAPIVMTALERKTPTPGYWGGLVITGNAKINNCKATATSCDNIVEGVQNNAPKFGGTNDDDNSGVLKYVRVEWAGFTLSENNELNSISLYAVGRGTQIDYIEAYKGADDGVELFGGTVNLKHVVLIDSDDDGLDWDNGWTGAAQYVLIIPENATEADPRGIEADNLKSPMDALPRSNPTLSNITIIGKGNNPKLLDGIMLRRGTMAKFYNTVISGTFQQCINFDDEETFKVGGNLVNGVVEQTGIVMQNSISACANGVNFQDDPADLWAISVWFNAPGASNYVIDPQLKGTSPAEGSPMLETGLTPPASVNGFAFDQVDFIGALSGAADEDWTAGWVVL